MHTESDWMILDITDKGPAQHYRFHVEGVNLSDKGRTFSWGVPSVANERYAAHPDASDAVRAAIEAAKAAAKGD